MNFQDLSIDRVDHVAVLTLERPETRNVISDEPLVHELVEACELLGSDRDVHAVVLTGRGSAFSAGGNIRQMHERAGMFGGPTDAIASRYRSGIQTLIKAVFSMPIPSIAAVNGPAIGAGFDLALACDLRLASSTAKFGETFVNLGLIPGDGGSWLLPRAVGPQRAAELAFTGRIVDAQEAAQLGLILSVHEPDSLVPAAIELATTIASKPPVAMRYTKTLLRRAADT
ncbi:enoyl-CoA hydratase-related protein, partial [Gemmatimonas sp.]|uniref:enoyl-CoA hydratase-related protein n=1 Tax=Gemmatimonas sp. TaxID=1962908 RepID=UPI003564CF8A